jgi:catalase
VASVHNNQRDGHMRQTINMSRTSYEPNTLGGGCPFQAGARQGGFVSYPAPMDDVKRRARGEKFFDHFSQATLFYNSQSEHEKNHIVQALRFELGKVETAAVRERMVGMLANVDRTLAEKVADGLGLPAVPKVEPPLNRSIPADGNPRDFEPRKPRKTLETSAALSMANTVKDTVMTRKVAILAADGVDGAAVESMRKALTAAGAMARIVAPRGGMLKAVRGANQPVDFSLPTVGSVLFDAVFIPGGADSVKALAADARAQLFVTEAYKHCKALAATDEGVSLLPGAGDRGMNGNRAGALEEGVIAGDNGDLSKVAAAFIAAIARHRAWSREAKAETIPV